MKRGGLSAALVVVALYVGATTAHAADAVRERLRHAQHAMHELRELAHGILPAALTRGGLRAGLDAMASRMPMPIEIDAPVGRLPAAVEATAYFVVSEALTNVIKHARAGRAAVTARIDDGTLALRVRDNGVGGARGRERSCRDGGPARRHQRGAPGRESGRRRHPRRRRDPAARLERPRFQGRGLAKPDARCDGRSCP
jgi:signal transduction histidine kinase